MDIEVHGVSSIHSTPVLESNQFENFDKDDLIAFLVELLSSNIRFSDILIHQDAPILLRQAKRLIAVGDWIVTKEMISKFFMTIEKNWLQRIEKRAFDRARLLSNCRIRANCFTFESGTRLGAVIRKFPKEPFDLESIGLRANAQNFAKLESGLILVVGDTCQGKSTTIASIVDKINKTRAGHILTIEDPIETLIPSRKCMVTQREVGPDADVDSFYSGTLDALRERPDVVMIGEIRDAETAREALALSEAGPLVIASLHARSVDMGITKFLRLLGDEKHHSQAFANALQGIVCQALVPSIDGETYKLATETLTMNENFSRLIENRQLNSIRTTIDSLKANPTSGCHTMNSDLFELCKKGEILAVDAIKASTDKEQLSIMLKQLQA